VTFLVGRESGRGPQPASATAPTRAGADQVLPGVASRPGADRPVPPAPAIEGPPETAPVAAPIDVPFPSVAAATQATTRNPETTRNEVASYFREVEVIQSQGKSWDDPQALAQSLLDQATKGDVSGFDGLAAANRKVRDALAAV